MTLIGSNGWGKRGNPAFFTHCFLIPPDLIAFCLDTLRSTSTTQSEPRQRLFSPSRHSLLFQRCLLGSGLQINISVWPYLFFGGLVSLIRLDLLSFSHGGVVWRPLCYDVAHVEATSQGHRQDKESLEMPFTWSHWRLHAVLSRTRWTRGDALRLETLLVFNIVTGKLIYIRLYAKMIIKNMQSMNYETWLSIYLTRFVEGDPN